MNKLFHIVNGDALKEKFPDSLKGEIIVFRECLMDGNIDGHNLTDFYKTRAEFIRKNYHDFKASDYYEMTVTEFEKIQQIPQDADINLWFEDDLFCQVNLWFTINLLDSFRKHQQLFLIRPQSYSAYNFAGLSTTELESAFRNRLKLKDIHTLATLWEHYQKNDLKNLLSAAMELKEVYPYILQAVNAHIERIPKNGKPGKPSETLKRIMNDLHTTEFAPVFQEFCKREAIYGFGDVQVKRLFDEIIQNDNSK